MGLQTVAQALQAVRADHRRVLLQLEAVQSVARIDARRADMLIERLTERIRRLEERVPPA